LRFACREDRGFVRGHEMRREHLDGLDGPAAVGDGDDLFRIELVPLSPKTPGFLDACGGVYDNTVKVEQDGRARK